MKKSWRTNQPTNQPTLKTKETNIYIFALGIILYEKKKKRSTNWIKKNQQNNPSFDYV